ncbi:MULTISPECIES: chloride channel protein [Reichenbachiella]|uniref:Chloride channel protein, CIC family n=1 Tax=Reichenbachiella agariperforans TaxID=156994 RepID=A0A1M6VXK3_REIAG|nr:MULTISPECIES: chloride channel protein [Reichenbachiella]MBU2915282.1 chloride channel protein [Reichenbachiella agariperforans]RJE70941.1 chloride channel protein [Reichenbachiella sp. MSK19-1]SHK86154.1 chloride channel protein, CIC family [Reichenbachiella agariperforans]
MNFRDLLVKFLVWRLKHISNNNFILILSGIVGLVSGFAAVTLKSAVHLLQHVLHDIRVNNDLNILYMVYPVIGIFLTVLVSKYILKDKMGHGITKILYYISKRSSVVKRTMTYTRMITSTITVGFGGSVGLEAPIVVTGSAIGSNLGRLTHMNYKKRTLLIACGASGAIAAIFNSPIAGVIFAIEVILTDVTINKFIPILISSVVGSMVSYTLLGRELLFSFKLQDAFKPEHIHFYILLGIACGIISVHFTRLTYLVENAVEKIKNDLNRALLGGLGLALIIFAFPPIYGEGYNVILNLLNGNDAVIFDESLIYGESDKTLIVIALLFAILVIKPVASALTIGAGGSGGIFAPSLFMGGIGGYLFARTINYIFPVQIDQSHFTLVGMCGVMSGVLHAPLTAIFLIAEITGGYELFVPLMLVSAISFTTINYFEPYSLYTKPLIEKGDLIQHDKDRQVLSQMNMRKLIESDLLSIKYDASLDDLIKLVKKSKRNIFPVLNYEQGLEGIVTLDDIRDRMFDEEKRKSIIVKQVMQLPPAEVNPDDSMEEVMNKFEITQAWNLPVIENGKYLGFLSKSRIFNAYRTRLISNDKE